MEKKGKNRSFVGWMALLLLRLLALFVGVLVPGGNIEITASAGIFKIISIV